MINRTPPRLLKEIILVDDYSDSSELKSLDDEIAKLVGRQADDKNRLNRYNLFIDYVMAAVVISMYYSLFSRLKQSTLGCLRGVD